MLKFKLIRKEEQPYLDKVLCCTDMRGLQSIPNTYVHWHLQDT